MRYIKIEDARAGMVLGQQIYDYENRNLLSAGKLLSKQMIQKLTGYGYPGVYIEDELSEDIQIQEVISSELRSHAVRSLKELDIDTTIDVAHNIVSQILDANTVSLDMVDLRTYDDYTFCHSVNVAVLSSTIGMGMGFSEADLIDLCAAAIFHDFGKLIIDKKILNKPGKLSYVENQIMRKHPQNSYEMLCEKWNMPSRVKMGVLCHHENEDGSGYPLGLTGDKIHPFAKIIHVADVYDALSSKRPYKKAYSFSESLEYLMGGCSTMFDRNMVQAFMKYVPIYPKGMGVILSDKREGIVIENYSSNSLRPKVRLLTGEVIDLRDEEKYRNITILNQSGTDVLAEKELEEVENARRIPGNKSEKVSHILVVDDMVDTLRAVKSILDPYYKVTLLKSGQQAIQYLKNNQPDLILMDINMPSKSGIETVREIELELKKRIPVIFLTVISDLQTVLECRDTHAEDYIIKPYEPEYLLERVQAALGEKR